ncbi:MAG: hypothetical protein IKN04_04600 [Clostridia bacterium]|nr:hypothetical protein [Clostridia bacterium]
MVRKEYYTGALPRTPPGRCPSWTHACGSGLMWQINNSPLFLGEKANPSIISLLARRLKAASPDAKHPGKARE